MQFKWEEMSAEMPDNYMEITLRAKVFGGWLVRHQTGSKIRENEGFDDLWQAVETMVFVADPNHEWEIE